MKKIILIFLCIFFSACNSPIQNSIININNNSSKNNSITVNKLEINYVDDSIMKNILKDSYYKLIQHKGYQLISDNKNIYLYIGLGEKPTGGYDMKIINMEDNEGYLNIRYEEMIPYNNMVIESLTYPHKFIKINFMPRGVNIYSKGNIKLV